MHCQRTESTAVGVFNTSSTNVDLLCEDEDLELSSSKFTKSAPGRAGGLEDADVTNVDDLSPASGVTLLYLCKKCGESFHDLGRVEEHSKLHAAECSYQCSICRKEFVRTASLGMHKLVHLSDRPHRCPECDKGFVYKSDFWRHLWNVHKIGHPKTLKNGSWGVESLAQLHQTSDKMISQVCTDNAGREWAPKPYLCPTCGKGFRTSVLLSKHKVIHRPDKPYECQECGKAFVELLRLKRHQHIHTRKPLFYCEECGRSFMRLTSRHRHQPVHTGERPYS